MWDQSHKIIHPKKPHDYAIFVTFAAFVGYALTLGMNAVAAHILPANSFGEFSSAIAMVGIICTCATLGMEKYALRLLPEYMLAKDLKKVKGYIFFGIAICTLVGIAISLGALFFYDTFKSHQQHLSVLSQMLWFVPAIAIFLFLLEITTTFGSIVWSTAIYRIIFPFFALGTMLALSWISASPTISEAINLYGFSWVAALVLMTILLFLRAPNGIFDSPFSFAPKQWLTEGFEYLGFSLLMTIFSQAAILTIEIVSGDRGSVGLIAAAMQISMLIIIVQTATIRVFAPKLANLITKNDTKGQQQLMRQRLRYMLTFGIVFLSAVLLFGREMLQIFGSGFDVAYPTLVVLTIGNVINTIFGFAPTYLQFHEAHATTLRIATGGTVLGVVAMALASAYGSYLDVAYAYSGSAIVMYSTFQIAAMAVSRKVNAANS